MVQLTEGLGYADKQENKDSKFLKNLNSKLNFFIEMKGLPKYSEIDFLCKDRKGRKVHVELKERSESLADFQRFGDVLIEVGKIHATSRIMESGYTLDEQRLYINFCKDCVIIFNLNKIKDMRFYPNHKQWNPMKNSFEYEDRIGLRMKDAIIYKKENEEYIKV